MTATTLYDPGTSEHPAPTDTLPAVMHLSRELTGVEVDAAALFGVEVHGWCGRWRVPLRPIPQPYRICRSCAASKARAIMGRAA